MASEKASLQSEGALYELIARGNKDTYFMRRDAAEGATPLLNPFDRSYNRRPATVGELRRIPPLNAADFGRTTEFEFEIAGDVFTDTTLLIDLPTWLPAPAAAANAATGYTVATAAGRQYGYTRGIAYFLFSKIQLYQDKVLLQEFSGDALWGSRLARGTLNQAYLDQALTAMTDPSGATLYRLATPGRLRLPLPMVGGKRGVPSAAIKGQSFRLRLTLRPLEDCVECSDDAVTRPAPWTEAAFIVTPDSGTPTSYPPLPRELIKGPTLQLETRHIYLDPESRAAVEAGPHEIPYSVLYENMFSFGPDDYKGANVAAGLFPLYTRVLDAKRPASRVFWFMRSEDDLRRNRRWATGSAANPYWATLSLIIAARDRETAWGPTVWNTLVQYAKEDRGSGYTVGEMNWDMGVGPGLAAAGVVPQGSVNFTTADRPTFLVGIRPPDGTFTTERMNFLAVVESWGVYTVADGRAMFRYN
ncbi:hypothetical protein EBZ80_21875 [bacterium]|nr:hypothetical protein [bacterium]